MILIVDYHMGNVGSISNMLKHIGEKSTISSRVEDIAIADKLILPGVGSFDNGMRNITKLGLLEILIKRVRVDKIPILGICLGMQLLTKRSDEGTLKGLEWIDAETVAFNFPAHGVEKIYKVPHMGWNEVKPVYDSRLFTDMYPNPRFYHVHSFHVKCEDPSAILATTHYGYEFVSVVEKGNVLGTQFHPEKSHKFGMKLLKNFVELY